MRPCRSWFLVGCAAAATAWPSLAQPGPLVSCVASSLPFPVYASGIAEPVADILLQCSSDAPALTASRQDLHATVSVSLNTTVTNATRDGDVGLLSDAALVVNGNDCPAPSERGSTFGSCGAPMSYVQDPQLGRITGPNALEWSDVTIPFPGSWRADGSGPANPPVATMRIRGLRANASQLRAAPGLATDGPPVEATLDLRSDEAITLRTGQLELAHPAPGLWLDTVGEESTSACLGDHRGRATLRLREGFARAFDTGVAGLSGSVPTRVLLEFSEVPDDVAVSLPSAVSCDQRRYDGGNGRIPDAVLLAMVTGHDSDGYGGTAGLGTGGTEPDVSVDLVSGAGRAVYEVQAHDPERVEDCHIPVMFETEQGRAARARARIAASLAPRSSHHGASPLAPRPRFASPGRGWETQVDLGACGTTLMFPFVTNQAGFTTGVVITLGSQLALKGEPVEAAGSCDLHYYGSTAEDEDVLLIQHSTVIDPGEQLIFTLSGGNPASNILGTNQFEGYMMAVCGYPDARGYVFVSDGFGGIADLAMGYLAPVIPLRSDGKRIVLGDDAQ